jgi:hypothetical protein
LDVLKTGEVSYFKVERFIEIDPEEASVGLELGSRRLVECQGQLLNLLLY